MMKGVDTVVGEKETEDEGEEGGRVQGMRGRLGGSGRSGWRRRRKEVSFGLKKRVVMSCRRTKRADWFLVVLQVDDEADDDASRRFGTPGRIAKEL